MPDESASATPVVSESAGTEIQQQLWQLNQQMNQLQEQGHYQQAISLATQACELAQRHLGQEHPDTAVSLNNLGLLLQNKGEYASARSCYEQALAINRKVLGAEHPNTVTCLTHLGGLLQDVGDYEAARSHQEQALAINRKVLGEDHPNTARNLNNLGELLRGMGDYAAARSHLEQALAIRRKVLGEEHPDTATSLNNLGTLLQAVGDYAVARPYYEQALAIKRKVLGQEHPDTATSLTALGVLLQAMGDYAAARSYLEQTLAILREVLGEDHPNTARSLNNLGELLRGMGDYAAARSHHEQALAINRKVLGEEHPDTATSLNNLGNLLQAVGDYEAARPYFEQALAINRKVLGEEHPVTATSLSNQGVVLRDLGDYAAARSYQEQALAVRRKVLGEEHPDTATSLNNLGILFFHLGDSAAARPYFERALAVNRKVLGEDHPGTALSLTNLGSLCAASNRLTEAFHFLAQAAKISDRMLDQIFSISSERERLGYLKSVQNDLAGFLSLVSRHLADSPPAVRAALELVLRRKAITAEAQAAQRSAVLSGRYPALREQLHELDRLRNQIAQKTLAGPQAGQALAAYRQLLDQLNADRERLERELAQQIPEINLEKQLRAADRRAVALALPEGVALVEFVRFDLFDFQAIEVRGERRWKPARYLAFVLPAGDSDNVQMFDLGQAEPIDQLIADFRYSIARDPGDKRSMTLVEDPSAAAGEGHREKGRPLRQILFDPLRKALAGREELLLAPDGDLTRLPFEVLPEDAEGTYLIDHYWISYVATGRDVLRFQAETTAQPTAPLVAADPNFNLTAAKPASLLRWEEGGKVGRSSRDLDRSRLCGRLPGTRTEGETIAGLLGLKKPLLEDEVLEASLKQMRSPRILHLATHGFFLQDQQFDPNEASRDLGLASDLDRLTGLRVENPMLRSGLILAGFNTWVKGGCPPPEAEDGMLTAEDVAGLDLLATELVVLSACDTGLGQVHAGEGVFGLRRAFVVAGAKTLVMSLWKVPDQQTQELMVDFYRRLLKGVPRYEALRQAQLELKRRYSDPYFWGAFICQGEPFPLSPADGTPL